MKKLSRSERATAYAAFLSAASRRWEEFSKRDRIAKANGRDSAEVEDISQQIVDLRGEMYEAYCSIQILGSHQAVEASLGLIKLYDRRNASFFDAKKKSPGSDERANQLGRFVEAARGYLLLKSFGGRLSR